MNRWVRVVSAVFFALLIVVAPDSASWAVDCVATPDDPACVSPSESSSPSPSSAEPSPDTSSSPSPSPTTSATVEPSADPTATPTGDPAPTVVELSNDDRVFFAVGIGLILALAGASLVSAWGRDG